MEESALYKIFVQVGVLKSLQDEVDTDSTVQTQVSVF